ncbi:uncharacterized protein LOC105442150 [Strongylocentrotus purpuratus]|uniref:Death domain-containing protein n=1 Tax=Strongylocentrotus purpuratus TaxID=7668 RepID=A0A7M7NYB3_STRPU|nr:uncharacterized protein LOC105442150 [Strongylocentrotus purpuratus]
MDIKFRTHFLASRGITETSLGDTVSTSPSPSPSTSDSVAISFQDASATAGEVSTSRDSDTVSDGKLNTLAAHIPPDKYLHLPDKLGIEYNEASCILKQHGKDYKGAMRECLSIWKNKSRGSFTDLKRIFGSVHLGGIWKQYMK